MIFLIVYTIDKKRSSWDYWRGD